MGEIFQLFSSDSNSIRGYPGNSINFYFFTKFTGINRYGDGDITDQAGSKQ